MDLRSHVDWSTNVRSVVAHAISALVVTSKSEIDNLDVIVLV